MGPFSNGSSHNGRQGASKGKLEEPVVILDVTSQEKAIVSNKGLSLSCVIASIRKCVTHGPKAGIDNKKAKWMSMFHHFFVEKQKLFAAQHSRESTSAGIEQVPKDHILDILCTDGSSTKHGKASLHEVHKGSSKDQVKGIHTPSKAGGSFDPRL